MSTSSSNETTTAVVGDSELRLVVSLTRHGSRAPNTIAKSLCPNNLGNFAKYHVPPEQLTEYGMEQLRRAGDHIRAEYVHKAKFLSPSINGPDHFHFESYFRADSADRCGQSAIAMGYGLYPDGTGPKGFEKQPISVYMQLLKNEHEFAAPKGPCKAVNKADINLYQTTRGAELIEQNRPMLEAIGKLCGVSVWDIPNLPDGEDIITGIKDLADMFTFDQQQGLEPLAGLTPELQTQIEELSFTHLMERYYSTPRQVTYWVGGFADLLLKNVHQPTRPTPDEGGFKYYSYHGHREMLHGLGKMLGWDFHFEGLQTALNTSSLHPGTTMLFEVRERNTKFFLNTFLWSPKTGRQAVHLAKCSALDCPLDEFASIITNHIAETGTWQQICNFAPSTFAPVHRVTVAPAANANAAPQYTFLLPTVGGLLAVLALLAMLVHRVIKRRDTGYKALA
ncbi:hypothetical protein SPRG_05952 [Saprolegnia parasitica CBS 223.65]|uniref:Histidine acid phosphatase n=1 Tax=Saprolegnia parasitica (strain CBS 223.65) TaxID=695850 RepID=A0A067CJN8_SAPPC|nr:hypothetical protein SPRG_05952 [Saprolegnia parasitica CBS 223.65]KDO29415.1 hypothetical protein SPRG_05952 [Saprolegnia parasitica CBS 223.65]|eukprot:XP_012199917.1 hypothetical protein SPRG_05952 [Saprolegnia parasitica CBS 223.65]